MSDVLTGKDEMIGPEDFLNGKPYQTIIKLVLNGIIFADVSHSEVLAPTHMLCERHGL